MAMDIPLDEVIYVEAISSSSTGAAVDADSTPTFAVYEEATDTDIGVGGNMTKRTSLTGDYRANFTASAANGFELGKWYVVIGSATIGGVATKGILARFRIVAAESVVGYPLVDTQKWLGGTIPAVNVTGVPKVDATHVAGTSQTARDLGNALPAAAPNANGGLPILSVSGTTLAYTVSTLTTYTGNTPQTGDSFARLTGTGAVTFASLTVSGATTFTGAVTGTNASNNLSGIDVAKISGDATAADNAESFFDGTGYAGTNNVIPLVTLTTTTTSVSNRVTANVDQLNGTSIGGTGSRVADAFVLFFNIASPTLTTAGINQTGDSFARIGSTGSSLTSLAQASTALTNATWTDARAAKLDNLDATVSSRLATVGYTAPLDAAGIRTALGMATNNLDSQLGSIDDYIDTEVGAIKAKTDNLPSDPADASDVAAAFATVNATLATISSYVDTEVAAILAATVTEVADIKTVTDRLSGMLEFDDPVYRYTANALEQAPTGGGGSSLTQQNVRDAMKLAPSSGSFAVGSVDQDIDSIIGLLTGTGLTVTVSGPEPNHAGHLPIQIGDDYYAVDGRSIDQTVETLIDLTTVTIKMYIYKSSIEEYGLLTPDGIDCTAVLTDTDTYLVRTDIPRATTSAMTPGGQHRYEVKVTSPRVATLYDGVFDATGSV